MHFLLNSKRKSPIWMSKLVTNQFGESRSWLRCSTLNSASVSAQKNLWGCLVKSLPNYCWAGIENSLRSAVETANPSNKFPDDGGKNRSPCVTEYPLNCPLEPLVTAAVTQPRQSSTGKDTINECDGGSEVGYATWRVGYVALHRLINLSILIG